MIPLMPRKLSHPELLMRQSLSRDLPKLPFHVVINNIRSLHNVGSIFRTADGIGVEKIWLCGITGFPPSPKISKTALGAENSVVWEYRKNVSDCVQELKKAGFRIALLEQTSQSIPHQKFDPPFPLALVVGNEIQGVCETILPDCDYAIEIEMQGEKNSLNVAVAFGIAAYDIRNKFIARKRA